MFQVLVVLLYLSVLLGLYVVPLYITSPCIMDPTSLKQRPDVIGHQGAPMVSELTGHFIQIVLHMLSHFHTLPDISFAAGKTPNLSVVDDTLRIWSV